jgi:hypothetical protein
MYNYIQPYRITVKRLTPMSNNHFAQGRPATGRTFAVSVRITKEAADILNTKRNKSEYIDHLIKQDERLNHLLHSKTPTM